MKINKEIYRIAVPAIVSNITVPLLGLADTTISGHLGSEKYIAAIAVGTMMMNVVVWCLGFLRSGTTGLTAQALGSNDRRGVNELFTRSLVLGLAAGLLMICLQEPLLRLLLTAISADTSVSEYAGQYFRIVIAGAPALLGTMAVSGWFLGMQSSFYPMIIAIVTNIINISGSLLAVYQMGYGFAGTAIGTCFANWAGLALALLLARRFNGGKLPLGGIKKSLSLRGSGRFFKVNSDIFMRSFCIIAVSLGMTSLGARIGSTTLAMNAVMMQFFVFFSYFMDGFAFAGEALTGRYAGAKDESMLRKTNRSLLLWGVGMAAVFTILYASFGAQISRFITPERGVLEAMEEFRLWLVLIPSVSVAAFIYDGIYIGLTATRQMLAATLGGAAIFFAVNLIAVDDGKTATVSNMYLWTSFLLYLLTRGATLGLLCKRATRKALQGKTL